jgi:hypothetical protein
MFTMIFNLTRKGRGFMTSMNDLLLPYKQTDNQSNLFHHSLDKYQNHYACDNGRDTDWANHRKKTEAFCMLHILGTPENRQQRRAENKWDIHTTNASIYAPWSDS